MQPSMIQLALRRSGQLWSRQQAPIQPLRSTYLAPRSALVVTPTTTARLYSALGSKPIPSSSSSSSSSVQQASSSGSAGDSGSEAPVRLSDPYPLPFSPEIVQMNNAQLWDGVDLASESQIIEGVDAPMRVPGREDEDRDTKIARLVYQCRKRGTLETDLILSTFAKKELRSLGDQELHELDMLLDEPDWDIFYWCTQRKPVPPKWADSFKTEGKLGWRLVKHTKNEEKAVRWMPELK